jgi:hypothetical protein
MKIGFRMPIYAEIDEELEKRFRLEVLKRYGPGKIKKALEEAIRLWLKKYER